MAGGAFAYGVKAAGRGLIAPRFRNSRLAAGLSLDPTNFVDLAYHIVEFERQTHFFATNVILLTHMFTTLMNCLRL